MKTLLLLISITTVCNLSWSQTTTILQPDATNGKDAVIWYLSTQNGTFGPTNSTPQPTDESFQAMQWTWMGYSGVRKSLIDFDLSSIPANSTITNAQISFYAFPNSVDGGHSDLSGSNACYLHEISSPWDENSVTWNTQPTINNGNQIILPQSTSEFDDYINFDVTPIIQNKYANPTLSHGFMFSIINPTYYRKMIFASSDHPDPMKRPKLEITYTSTNDNKEIEDDLELSIYPNPTYGIVNINSTVNFSYTLTDLIGREIYPNVMGQNGINTIDLTGEPKGVYILNIMVNNKLFAKRIVLE